MTLFDEMCGKIREVEMKNHYKGYNMEGNKAKSIQRGVVKVVI